MYYNFRSLRSLKILAAPQGAGLGLRPTLHLGEQDSQRGYWGALIRIKPDQGAHGGYTGWTLKVDIQTTMVSFLYKSILRPNLKPSFYNRSEIFW